MPIPPRTGVAAATTFRRGNRPHAAVVNLGDAFRSVYDGRPSDRCVPPADRNSFPSIIRKCRRNALEMVVSDGLVSKMKTNVIFQPITQRTRVDRFPRLQSSMFVAAFIRTTKHARRFPCEDFSYFLFRLR